MKQQAFGAHGQKRPTRIAYRRLDNWLADAS
jgi:hypothetical protein